MNHHRLYLYALWFISFSYHLHAAVRLAEQPWGLTYYTIRSQGANRARQLSGTIGQIYPYLSDCWWGMFSLTPSYTRTFDSSEITQSLWGTLLNNNDALVISGSQVANRAATDLLADYFYLPTDFRSTVHFDPVIDNIIFDINLFVSLNAWCDGWYINIYAPFVHSRWDLGMCETIAFNERGINDYPAGYFTPAATPRNRLNTSFTAYANGISSTPINQTLTPGGDFSVVFEPLQYAKLSSSRRSTSRLADIRFQVGWMYAYDTYLESSVYAHVSMPTGNRPEAKFFFEPMAGNGHHWELGGGVYGRYRLYENCDEIYALDMQWDGYVTTLFGTRQRRTFDLERGPGSRYMLAERISTPVEDNLRAGSAAVNIPVNAQFQQDFVPVANISTVLVDVNSKIAAEWTLLLVGTMNCVTATVGYNGYWRGCDSITQRAGISRIELNGYWALKGDASVFGYVAAGDPTLAADTPVALSATDNTATIHAGSNNPIGSNDFAAGQRNPSIDNPLFAFAGTGPTALLYAPGVANIAANQINTSAQPILLKATDLAIRRGETSFLSNKLFGHLQYSFNYCNGWQPYIGIGAEVEKGSSTQVCALKCTCCNRVSTSQWGIWFKGGMSF